MTDKEHSDGRPGAFSASPTPTPDNPAAKSDTTPAVPASGGLMGNFVRQTDNDYNGIDDPSLIGEDIGDDLVDENGDPIED